METHLQATLARIQEIQARLSSLTNAEPVQTSPQTSGTGQALLTRGANNANQPFPVMLAQIGDGLQTRPLNGAGPFTPEVESLVTKYAGWNGLSPDLVRAVIQQESGGNPRSVSAVGAKGLMQLMPETAQAYGVQDAFDPEMNIAAGTRHLSGLLREFNGDIPKALAAYNAGSGAVKKFGGVPPYGETQQYVRKIMGMLGQKW